MLPQTQGGHLELQKLMQSPYIDYFASPYDYTYRLMGQDGRLRGLPQAFQLGGKVHMVEADTRTYLHAIDEYGRTADAQSSVAAIRREMTTALTGPTALWWCDFGSDGSGGWYDDPPLIGAVKDMVELAQTRLAQTREATAQVAVVCDPPSMYLLSDVQGMQAHYALLEGVTTELYRTGTPFDQILLDELPKADLARYKMIIFLDTLIVEPAMRAKVKEATKGREVLWLWAPGISDGKGFGADLVRDLTGFKVALKGEGVPVSGLVAVGDDRLVAGLPQTKKVEMTVERTAPLPEALDAAQWFNPRTVDEMKEYKAFEWSVADGALRWHFATNVGWSDIHLKAGLPSCEGVRLTFRGEGDVVGASLRLVVKDANTAEFVAPRQKISAEDQTLTFALAELERAPWPAGSADEMTLPITGMKLVIEGFNGTEGTLVVSDLSAVWGKVVQSLQRGYKSPGVYPCLVVDDAEAQTLGRDPVSGAAVLAARGKAPRQVLATVPYVPHELLTAMMDEAGVTRYIDSTEVVVRADSRLVAIHTAKAGRYTLHLPKAAEVRDEVTGEVLGKGQSVTVELKGPETKVLELR